MSTAPPLPNGYQLEQAQGSTPPLPNGYTLAQSSNTPPLPTGYKLSAPQTRDRIADSLENATISPPESGFAATIDRFKNKVRDFMGADHKPAGDVMGGMVLGPLNVAHGAAITPEHPIRGAHEVISGIGQTVALPAAVLNPGTMAYAAPAIAAQTGVTEGLKTAGADQDYANLAGDVAGIGAGIGTAGAFKPRVPRSALSKTVKPADPVAFHAAEQSVIPKINAAAQDLGQPIKTTDDAIAAIRQAKQNALLDAHEAAGPGKTIADLPPEQVKALQDDMSALDTLDQHLKTAQESAAKTKPQPTASESVGQIVKGGAKVAAGTAVAPIPVVGHAAGVLGLFKGAPEIASGIKNLVARRALTPENLDAAVQQTFGSVEPAVRSAAPADVPGKPAFQPASDLSVQHEGNIAPPETPHGDATVYPDRPNPAIVSSGSTAQPLAAKPMAIGPNERPVASTTQLDSTLKVQPPEQIVPPVKQPLKATTPAAQTAEVLKKAGVQQALKDAGVAAPSATVRQIRPGVEVGPTLTPRMDLTFYGDKTGEGASLMQLTRYNINELRAMAVQRGLDVSPTETHVQLIEKIHDDLSPQEIKEFGDAAAERGRFSPPAKVKRGSQPQAAEPAPQPQIATEANTEDLLQQSIAQAQAKKVTVQPQAKSAAAGAGSIYERSGIARDPETGRMVRKIDLNAPPEERVIPPNATARGGPPPAVEISQPAANQGGFSLAQESTAHGAGGASVEELARGETFWRIKKNGQLSYQGVSPDANLGDGEALVAINKSTGKMRVQDQRMGLGDEALLGKFGNRVKAAANVNQGSLGAKPQGFQNTPPSSQSGFARLDTAQTLSDAFKKWFGESQVKDESGKPIVVYRGDYRGDKLGPSFKTSKTTSGRFYFTDDPEIASKYSQNKPDLSTVEEHYGQNFTFPDLKYPRERTAPNLDQAWYRLSPEQKERVKNVVENTTMDDDGKLKFDAGQSIYPNDDLPRKLRLEHNGNWLKLAQDIWLDSGNLFDREKDFEQIMAKAGLNADYDSAHLPRSVVTPVYLSIKNPLDTSAIPQEVISRLDEIAKSDRSRPAKYGVDQWDKSTISTKDWIQRLHDDVANGTTHAWTSVPEKVTKALQSMGYDGIKDSGGKMGGSKHSVWIAFEPQQIKSSIGNRGTFNPKSPKIIDQEIAPRDLPKSIALSDFAGMPS